MNLRAVAALTVTPSPLTGDSGHTASACAGLGPRRGQTRSLCSWALGSPQGEPPPSLGPWKNKGRL